MVVTSCFPGTGAGGDPVYEGSTFTSGGVAIAGANDTVGTDSDLTFSGDTLTVTKLSSADYSAASAITLKPSGDTDDYFTFSTVSDVPTITATGGSYLALANNIQFNSVTAPMSLMTTAVNSDAGNLNGTYRYVVTYVTAYGETDHPCIPTVAVSPTNEKVDISDIPVSSNSQVIYRNIYRNKGVYADANFLYLVDTIPNNTSTTYTDNVADAALGARSPCVNTTGGGIYDGSDLSGNFSSILSTYAGFEAGKYSTGIFNTFFGTYSGKGVTGVTTGCNNSGFGCDTFLSITTGKDNVAVGDGSAAWLTTGDHNVFVGDHTAWAPISGVTTGSNNTIIGGQAGERLESGDGNVLIGFSSGFHLDTESNMLYIANTDTTTPLIGGVFPNTSLTFTSTTSTFSGSLEVANINKTTSQDLSLWNDIGTGRNFILQGTTATSGAPLKNSPSLAFYSKYWNGAESTVFGGRIISTQFGSGATPGADLNFLVNEVPSLTLENDNGTMKINAYGIITSNSYMRFNSSNDLGSAANLVQLGGYDLDATHRTLAIGTEEAVAADIGLASTHSLRVRINGATYKIPLVLVP
jgi:hypothetical protein